MKAILLAPGLSRVQRGYERFALDLAAQLRAGGIDATCWGTSESPGVEAIAVPGREELWKCASHRLRADPRFSSLAPEAFHDWGVYAEDQLFAIPAAARIAELLKQNEPLVVYAKWQGGLVDPSGAPTQLLKLLASASLEGKASLLVHTDYLHAPIDALVWKAGGNFHALGPWLTEQLVQLGVAGESIVELPMCVEAAAYNDCRRHRAELRREVGISPDAFVVLSVGSFDSTTPDKRHAHLLREITALAARQNVWWAVAGSRGPAATEWEQQARQILGPRFISLTNLPFERMPQIYGMADLFALASTEETFGLVYLEAQIAGLPAVIHDSVISRQICSALPPQIRNYSLVDMRRAGAAASAIEHWMTQLRSDSRNGAIRSILDDFARQQERRFGWEGVGPQYAASFRNLAQSVTKASAAVRRDFGTWDEQTHRQGLRLFEQGRPREALMLFGRSLGGRETSERWNDWAAAQLVANRSAEAEQGFRRALALDPRHAQAAANLGALLASSGRASEAIPLLVQGSAGVDSGQQAAIAPLLAACRAKQVSSGLPSDAEMTDLLRAVAGRDPQDEAECREHLSYYLAVLKAIPQAVPGQRLLGIGRNARVLATAFARWRGYREIQWRAPREAVAADEVRTGLPTDTGDKHFAASFSLQHFEIESVWPYDNVAFDLLFLGQSLEGLSRDPMLALSEANRVLKIGGHLLLTAPNVASAQAVHAVLHGKSPYVNGRFPAEGCEPTERHNREYASGEIECLAKAAGFATARIETRDVYCEPPDKIFPALAASGYPAGLRGDTIVLLARKDGPVCDRFPAALYDLSAQAPTENGSASENPVAAAPSAHAVRSTPSNRPLRVLVAHENLPRPDQSGAEFRLLQILRELRNQGHSVTYVAARGFEEDRYAPALAELGIDVYSSDAEVLRREGIEIVPQWTIHEMLREHQFDLAIFYLWFWMAVSIPEYYLDEVRRLSPLTRIAVLTDDCHGLREQRGATLSHAWSDRERAEDYRERESEILRNADLVLAISEDDRVRLSHGSPELRIELLPMCIDGGASGPEFDAREGLMYLADYNNPASCDAIDWYLKDVSPLVGESLRNLRVYLAGAGLRAEFAADHEGAEHVGFVPELAPEFAKRRIFISPVRYGTGIKTKNLHAMAHGVPLITTTIGAEGMELQHEQTALIADSAEDFARAVVRLHSDRALWRRLSENGRAHVLEKFSADRLGSLLRQSLDCARTLRAKPYHPEHAWSARLVERYFPELLTHYPAQQRTALRILAYARAAEQLAAAGNREEARRQLRHIFSYVPHRVPFETFFGELPSVAEIMERTYESLGEREGAAEFGHEAQQYAPGAFAASLSPKSIPRLAADPAAENPAAHHDRLPERGVSASHPIGRKLDFSVIVPTYNRRQTLAACLEALAHQSFSLRRYEVIVADDGSNDGTEEFCRSYHARYEFHYCRQANAGAGAARRIAVEKARGKLLMLINDDTIADRALLAQHWRAHRDFLGAKLAVLGDFRYPESARSRALTYFLSTEPFLFPQVTLAPGDHSKNAYFIASNLSIRREAVLAAGSFDAEFRIAEDTELGVRLRQMGFHVRYVPEARAIHDHVRFSMGDLIRRAELYGRTELQLLRKHPHLLGDGTGPFGRLDAEAIEKLRSYAAQQAKEVHEATASLEKLDAVDFVPFFSKASNGRTAADDVMEAFKVAVPAVFWFHIVRGFLAAWDGQRDDVPNLTTSIGVQPHEIHA